MTQRLIVIGAAFAGMYGALSVPRLCHLRHPSKADLEFMLTSPDPLWQSDQVSTFFAPMFPASLNMASASTGEDAVKLDRHLQSLADRPATFRPDTIAVAGGGFTGTEVETAMPAWLRKILGVRTNCRVVTVFF